MLKAIAVQDKEPLVRECWGSEKELYEKWHYKAGQGLETCIKATCEDLEALPVFQLFKVVDGSEQTIGMFGIEANNFLTGFFIKPKFRTKKYVSEFMKLVNGKLSKMWFVGLYEKNTRAQEFFKSNGAEKLFKLSGKDNQDVIFYMMTSGEL